jgi:ABC-type branched-subunit amino acid transport system ATPase component
VTALLEVRGVSQRFGPIQALDAADVDVPAGSITGLIGPNGSGKSTLMNVISGYLHPDAGVVALAGRPIQDLGPAQVYRSGVSRTFQRARVFPQMTVLDNMIVAAPLTLRGIFRLGPAKSARDRAHQLLRDFRLDQLAAAPARELSYGQTKLLEFAAVLMGQPRLLLLDEPTAGVNETLIGVMAERIQQLRVEGVTVMLVEHNMEFVMRLCDPVVVLDQGRPVFAGPAHDAQNSPIVLDAYLGG